MRTLESFLSQFPVKVILGEDVLKMATLELIAGIYPVYRILNRLFVKKQDGNYYGAY